MYALLVNVTINDPQEAPRRLQSEVVPRVSSAPGFVAGYWMRPAENRGWSVILFESEEAARAAGEVVESQPPEAVTVDSVQVQEVVAHA